MTWPWLALRGPILWAIAFSGIYALHGVGCAWGWPGVATPLGPLHGVVLAGVWLFALIGAGAIVLTGPRGADRAAAITRLGGWIGLAATLLTLFPVLGVTSCG